MKLSAVIIAKNAEGLIEDCLTSVSFCDEIVVVDAGSTDNTVTLAKHMGARVIHGVDGDFSKQRNMGKDAAKGGWLLYIDTDERVSEDLREEIQKVVLGTSQAKEGSSTSFHSAQNDNIGKFSAYRLQRKNFYLGNHPWPKVEKLERLFQKSSLKEWYGKLHETARVDGEIGELHGYLFHYTHRDLSSMLSKTLIWSETEATLRLDAHHPKIVAWRLIRVMLTGFYDSYIRQGGWKAGTMGLIESIYQAYSMFITYARLWEIQQTKNQ